jgi:hypothetical protein
MLTDFAFALHLPLLRMRLLLTLLLLFILPRAYAQKDTTGILTGTVMDEKGKALEGTTIQLFRIDDSTSRRSVVSDKDGGFTLRAIPYGHYRLRLSYVGFHQLTLDSIHFRAERADFNLNDLVLRAATSGQLDPVIVYVEKPLVQSKDGNITFNASESALSAGSNASDLLTTVPLVTKDPDGKLLVRGKEPKILIDDKPVELNLQQLQDLLESMPGSSIEKIEVMTNPPPQFANEQGGVINITTRKGAIGVNGRVTVYGGTRGEAGANGSINYRRQGLNIGLNAGVGYNDFESEGFSRRQNLYADSSNFFNTTSNSSNRNLRPNARLNVVYDLNKQNSFNLSVQFNQNRFDNESITRYRNINRLEEVYRLRDRNILSSGTNINPNLNFSYTHRTKKPGEVLQLFGNYNWSDNESSRNFIEQYLNTDGTPSGNDSAQQQLNNNRSRGYSLRASYDVPVLKRKTFVSLGSFYNATRSDIAADAFFRRRSDGKWTPLDALTNHFLFNQTITNLRASVKQLLGENFSVTGGLSAERTAIRFDLYKTATDTSNSYWSFLPFANLNKSWNNKLNLTLAYRRTIRRPGIGELNPTVDFSDPYNIRFGNPTLRPSLAHNFDVVVGKTTPKFFVNLGVGYNHVQDIYNQIRTRLNNDTTQITWQNISGRKEYEVSSWSGYTLSRRMRINLSVNYTYNVYGEFDRTVRRFRNGGSLTSNLNGNYTWKELYTVTGNFTYNRFANPQGTVGSSVSMNLGLQARFWQKKLTATLNIVDPFVQQRNRTFTYGTNFNLENFSQTSTRNFRLSIGYSFSKTQKAKKPVADQLKKVLPAKKP